MLSQARLVPLVTVIMLAACGSGSSASPPASHIPTGGGTAGQATDAVPFATHGASVVTVGPTAPPG